MIKNFMCFFELLLVAFFVSCSNDEQMITQGKEVPVNFKVSTLNVETEPMSRAANATSGAQIGEVVNTICYFIYDSSNNHLVKEGSSFYGPDGDNSEFGTIKETLVPGTYQILFYALGKGNGSCTFASYSIFNYDSYFGYKDKEVFYYSGNLEITASTKMYDINLSRKSSLLRINITDQVPENISKVTFTINDYYRWYPKNSGSYRRQNEYEAKIIDSKVQTFDYYFSFPEALGATATAMIFCAYDSLNNLMGQKTIAIPIYANKRTIVSGELFSSFSDREMNICINDLWDEDINVPIE